MWHKCKCCRCGKYKYCHVKSLESRVLWKCDECEILTVIFTKESTADE